MFTYYCCRKKNPPWGGWGCDLPPMVALTCREIQMKRGPYGATMTTTQPGETVFIIK